MIQIKTRLRKWGNSFGIVVPQSAVNNEIKEDDEITVLISNKKPNIQKIFGILKDNKIDSQKIKNEIREEEANDSLLS